MLLHELSTSILMTSFYLLVLKWTHQKRQPPGAKYSQKSNGHNLRQPGPLEGHSSSGTEARTMLILIWSTHSSLQAAALSCSSTEKHPGTRFSCPFLTGSFHVFYRGIGVISLWGCWNTKLTAFSFCFSSDCLGRPRTWHVWHSEQTFPRGF